MSYREKLIEMIFKLSEKSVRRLYELACHLYVHYDYDYEKGGAAK